MSARFRSDYPQHADNWRDTEQSDQSLPNQTADSRSSLRKCPPSFSHQLEMIVKENVYDDFPRHAWGENSAELNSSHVNSTVVVGGTQIGVLRYIGNTNFSDEIWCGIELEDKLGLHDGTVKGISYFSCRPGYGLLAPLSKVCLAEPVERNSGQQRLEYDNISAVNRRSDPTGSSTNINYSNVNFNRFSDCTNDRISNHFSCEKYTKDITNDTSKSSSNIRNSTVQRKSAGESLPVKHILNRLPHLDAKNGSASGGVSPDDVTCDDSSLGILTPNQMPDFTNNSIQPSPSDDVVDLPMDTCEGATAVDLEAWDFSADASAVISELQKCDGDLLSSSGSSSPSQHNTASPKDRNILESSIRSRQQEKLQSKIQFNLANKEASIAELEERVGDRLVSPSTKCVSFIDPPPPLQVINIEVCSDALDAESDATKVYEESICSAVHTELCDEPMDVLQDSSVTKIKSFKGNNTAEEHGGVKPKQKTRQYPSSTDSFADESGSSSSNFGECGNLHQMPSVTRHTIPAARLLLTTKGGRHSVVDSCRSYEHSSEERPSDGSWHPSSMTLSSASLDPGYQGDGEFDVPSEIGSGSAGTPTQDPQESNLHEEIADAVQMPPDSSSSVATEADISLGDDEDEDDEDGESESSFIANRTARVIDGKLYHSHREMMLRGQEGQMRGADQHTSEMDSSGFYSDLDPREDENTRLDAPPLQPLEEFHDSDLQDNTVASSVGDNEIENKRKSVSRSTQVNGQSDLHGDEEERSTASTLRPESKEFTGSDRLEASPAPSEQTVKMSKSTEQCDSTSEFHNDDETNVELELNAEKVRNYEKPWLSKPVIRKPEPPKKIIAPPPPRPKKNVESKLKAMLASQEPTNEERKHRQPVKKNKWDEVMSKIAESKDDRPKVKEVKSRLLESLKAPATMSPQAERIRQERKERRERRERQAAATAAARRNAVRAERKRRYDTPKNMFILFGIFTLVTIS